MLGIICFAGIGLDPDEAQYWSWSRLLDWGYYSKPPGIAWQIWSTTHLFGNTELGVRFSAIIIGFLIPLAVYRLARCCNLSEHTSFWAGTTMALTPMGFAASFLATTDGGMVLFWTLACGEIARALQRKTAPNYTRAGLYIMCGSLFKWAIYFQWPLICLAMILFPIMRSKKILYGMALSLLGLLPSLVWNIQHGFATFRHVGGNIYANEAEATLGRYFLPFLSAQAGLLSPVIFVLWILGTIYLIRERKRMAPALLYCAAFSLCIVGSYSLIAIFKKLQGNWCVFAYPTAVVVAAWYAVERVKQGQKWLVGGLALSIAMIAFLLSIPRLQHKSLISSRYFPYRMNPFHAALGMDRVAEALDRAGYDPERHFLFGDKYQASSQLSFYGKDQKRAYFLNLHQLRNNQFCYWPSMSEERDGQTGFFVHTVNVDRSKEDASQIIAQYEMRLSPYFQKVRLVSQDDLFMAHEKPAKRVFIFECVGYNGNQPAISNLF